MTPSIGRIVHYTLTADDAKAINKRRADFTEHRKTEDYRDTGYMAHFGNHAEEGQVFPAVVVRVWRTNSINLQVLLDGTDTYWATSSVEGITPGTWAWPPRT